MINRRVLAKLLNLTTSSVDAEALAAMRKANQIVKLDGGTWEDVLGTGVTKRPVSGPIPARSTGARNAAQSGVPPEVVQFVTGLAEGMLYNLDRTMRGLPPKTPGRGR